MKRRLALAAAPVPMVAIALFAVFAAQWLNNSTGAMTLMIDNYAAAKPRPFVLPQTAAWSVFNGTSPAFAGAEGD